jgi:hypothetical protein
MGLVKSSGPNYRMAEPTITAIIELLSENWTGIAPAEAAAMGDKMTSTFEALSAFLLKQTSTTLLSPPE